jgi:ABC-type polysaccharide/polyol phosphate transport system ATPase subunit
MRRRWGGAHDVQKDAAFGGTHMQPLISLKGLVKSYKRGRQTVEVLRNLDLDVQPGEVLALTGPPALAAEAGA